MRSECEDASLVGIQGAGGSPWPVHPHVRGDGGAGAVDHGRRSGSPHVRGEGSNPETVRSERENASYVSGEKRSR